MFKIEVSMDDRESVLVEILPRDLVRLEASDPTFAKERAHAKTPEDGAELMTMGRLYTLAHSALLRMQRKNEVEGIPATLEEFIDSADVTAGDAANVDPTEPEPTTGE